MIRRPPRSTLSSSSAASDVYKRQELTEIHTRDMLMAQQEDEFEAALALDRARDAEREAFRIQQERLVASEAGNREAASQNVEGSSNHHPNPNPSPDPDPDEDSSDIFGARLLMEAAVQEQKEWDQAQRREELERRAREQLPDGARQEAKAKEWEQERTRRREGAERAPSQELRRMSNSSDRQ
eukprot:TRINITY_DN19056_c0_g1_i2.p1 TRINITY_DN19056_c0_g1~~TRINITY_DN19056_c0_g1_i2.p1  ORF type:complete len:183 (+),score=61.82 TRINITY_DN19056_c0_g1_i2:100-648(+)